MNLLSEQRAQRGFLLVVLAICAIVSVALSAWCIYIDDVINNDAVEYIRTAERLAVADWSGALSAYKWPFYPFLMLLVSDILGIAYGPAGYLLNSFFFTAATLLFVLIVRELGGDSCRLTVFAALVAIAHPAFNEYRAFIIRDAGYLALFLSAVYCLARYHHVGSLRFRIGVLAGFVVASLFRIEGLVFVFCTPLLLSITRKQRSMSAWPVLLTLIVAAAVLATILGWWLLMPDGSVSHQSVLDNPLQVVTTAWEQIAASTTAKLTVLRKEFLGKYSSEQAYVLFGFTVVMIIISAALTQLTVPWAGLALYGTVNQPRFPIAGMTPAWVSLVGIHGVVLLVGAAVMMYLKPRYQLSLSVTALLIVPFAIQRLLEEYSWRQLSVLHRLFVILVLLWGVGECVSGLDNFTRAAATKDAGHWLVDKVSTPGSLVTNDRRVAFYSGRHGDLQHIVTDVSQVLHGLRQGEWQDSEYVALRLQRQDLKSEAWVLEALGASPLKVFSHPKGDKVMVYRRP
ncbi:MAG TPA: hypothetical protein QGF27_12585 [Arenicellales bacterium]|nr:hypothetical protein [Arenicellales bacterium]MDP7217919.1 hypothetical protein [Arenicellales bacterium]HJP10860.1 hypothetical protein [Arenicellales bacterium]